MQKMLMRNEIIRLHIAGEEIEPGTIIRRVAKDRDRQDCPTGYDNGGSIILINVIKF